MSTVALRYLDTGEMIAITAPWFDQDKDLVASIPEVQVLVPAARAAHDTLIASRPASQSIHPRIEALTEALRQVDGRHDHALRAAYFAHEALAEHLLSLDPPDTAGAQEVKVNQEHLFPDGLGGTRLTYRAEVGNAQRAEDLAAQDPNVRAVLGRVRLSDTVDGFALIARMGTAGKAIDHLERERQQFGDTLKADPREAAARVAWSSIVNAVLAVLPHSKGPVEAVAQLRRSIVEPAEKAARRAAVRRANNEPLPVPPAAPSPSA